jgi:malate dehydrogenase
MISVIGAGKLGSSAAMRLAEMNLDDVLLVDIVEGLAEGEALDISHSCAFDVRVNGSNRFEDLAGSELVINTAGFPRKPGMTRLDLLAKNTEITRSVAEHIKRCAPDAIVMQVANPMDLMALVMMNTTGFPPQRVIGMGGMLDTLRFSHYISRALDVPPRKVSSMVIGEHSNRMVPLASQATVDGKPLRDLLDSERVDELIEMTRQAGAEVVRLRGSAFYAPARAIAIMAETLMKDLGRLVPTSVYLQGEYGFSDIFVGVPAKLGRAGLLEIVELELEGYELDAFRDCCEILKSKVEEMGSE